jgi:nitrite reductase/ring-hydroxylating ferredoxin subunit
VKNFVKKEEEGQATRRDFCAKTCQGAALAALGLIIEGCGGGGGGAGGSLTGPSGLTSLPVINATVQGGTVTLNIDSASPLAPVGNAALVRTSAGSLLVAHTGQDTFVALGATCTHQTCTITGFASGMYVCPCHGSEFSLAGQVLRGPAQSPLSQYNTQFTGGQLVIS